MTMPEYSFSEAGSLTTLLSGLTEPYVRLALFAPPHSRFENAIGHRVYIWALLPDGRGVFVICDRDRFSARRLIHHVRLMNETEHDELRRSAR